jgi:hypothetical protein
MPIKWLLAIAALASGCSAGAESPPEPFVLCSDSPSYMSTIGIDSEKLVGNIEDGQRPLSRCSSSRACLTYPLAISEPPSFPDSPSKVIRWSDGDLKFSIQQAAGGSDAYFITASGRIPSSRGGSIELPETTYTYSDKLGILSVKGKSDFPHGWFRCSGRLTFSDLRELVKRLPQPSR